MDRGEMERQAQLAEQHLQSRNQYYRQLRLQLRLRQVGGLPASEPATREVGDRAVREPHELVTTPEFASGEARGNGRRAREAEMCTHPPLISYCEV